MKLEFFKQIFEEYSSIELCENPSSGGRVVSLGHLDLTKLIVAFGHFTKAPKTESKQFV
jgi:hypothetical protein